MLNSSCAEQQAAATTLARWFQLPQAALEESVLLRVALDSRVRVGLRSGDAEMHLGELENGDRSLLWSVPPLMHNLGHTCLLKDTFLA